MRFEADPASRWNGLQTDAGELRLTDGRAATRVAAEDGVRDLAVFDLPIAPGGGEPGTPLALAFAASASAAWRAQAAEWLRIAGWQPQPVGDAPGLVVARTVAMLVNEGADAVHQGVCTTEGADLAMKLGVNHPAGPFEFLARWDATAIAAAARSARRPLSRRALPRQPGAARARLAGLLARSTLTRAGAHRRRTVGLNRHCVGPVPRSRRPTA